MDINIDRLKKTIMELVAIPSPCGFTDEIVHYVAGFLEHNGIEFQVTRRGTVRAKIAARGGSAEIKGRSSGQSRALVTHLDTIGAMVSYLKPDGRITVSPIGHWCSRFAEGARVTLFADHAIYRGTLLPMLEWGKSLDSGADEVPISWDHLELRLDEPVFNAKDVSELGIDVGDFIALDSSIEVLSNDYIVGRHLDNKAGVAILLEMLSQLTAAGAVLPEDLYVIFTITEVVGSSIGSAVLPEVSELVSVDFASVPPTEKSVFRKVNIAAADVGGPFDYHLTAHLEALAEQLGVPYRKNILNGYHNDAASALTAGHDVRTAVVTYAGDAAHSMERTHVDSLKNTINLLYAYATSSPTFEKDSEITTLEDFTRQIDEFHLPPSQEPLPNIQQIIKDNKE